LNTVSAKFVRCSRFSKCLIFLAVLLVLITATAQAVHFHPDASANEIKNCAVCQLAAATALAILVIALPILRRRITFAFCSDQPQAGSIFASFNLFSRPPPLA
jgi:membrane protein YdbS with pleckstrin-like domain